MRFTLVYREDLDDFRPLADQMFSDRRRQFIERLGWSLDADTKGRELDAYDAENPLYLIATDEEGNHLGSTRLMPTTAPTMINEVFTDLLGGVAITSATTWECTRFVVSASANRRVAPAIMWAGCALALRSGVDRYVSVTGTNLIRVFKASGWEPEIMGRSESEEGEICACLWEVSEEQCEKLRRRARIPEGTPAPRIHLREPVAHQSAVAA
ncbi:MAG: acyl-homoserine-lactone synthase [Pseudomonadota bacterium]